MKPVWQCGRLDLSIQAGRSFCFRFSISIFAPPIWHELLQRDSLPLFKVLHNLHFFIFFIQLIKELSTRSTRHTASRTIRCLVAECDKVLHLRLSAIHIHIKSGHAFCTQIKNPTAALNAETRENFSVFSFYCTYNMMCVNG